MTTILGVTRTAFAGTRFCDNVIDPGEVLCPAVLVKTRVCLGCSVSRAQKPPFGRSYFVFAHLMTSVLASYVDVLILEVRHTFLTPAKTNSFAIVRKYQLEITCRLSEIQSALLKSKCWQAKHIRTSSVECDTWPKIFAPDENLGDKRWLFVYFSL